MTLTVRLIRSQTQTIFSLFPQCRLWVLAPVTDPYILYIPLTVWLLLQVLALMTGPHILYIPLTVWLLLQVLALTKVPHIL